MDYEKILKGIVQIINTTEKSDIGFANICTYIGENCPELKESEGERMIKFIKNQLFNIKKTITENYELDAKLTKAIDWLEKQGEQKPAWSEKDDEMLDSIIEEVRYIGDFPDYPTKEENELYDECLAKVNWLKSIKDRIAGTTTEEGIRGTIGG